jgi:small subunit ribosomal protein S16
MAVVIRLQRTGKPHQPYYRVVAIEKARAASGKPVEILGTYNPREETAGKKVVIDSERYEHWVKIGAKPSETVATLVKSSKKAAAAAK